MDQNSHAAPDLNKSLKDYKKKTPKSEQIDAEIKRHILEKVKKAVDRWGTIKGPVKSSLFSNLKKTLKSRWGFTSKEIINAYKEHMHTIINRKSKTKEDYLEEEKSPEKSLKKEKELLDQSFKPFLDILDETFASLSSIKVSKMIFESIDKYHARALAVLKNGEADVNYNALLNLDEFIIGKIQKVKDSKGVVFDEILPQLKSILPFFFMYRENMIILLMEVGIQNATNDFDTGGK